MLKLFTPFLTAVAGTEMKAAAERAKRNAIFYGIIALAVFLCVLFLVVAAYLALAVSFGSVNSALLVAAASAIVALIAYGINRILEKVQKKRLEERRAAIDANAALTAAAVAAVPALLKKPLLTIALPLAGLAALSLLSRDKKPENQDKP